MECKNHKKAGRGEMSSAKVTSIFTASVSKSNDAALVGECEFSFHTMKHHSRYKTADCTSVLFKRIFPASDIAHKLSRAQTKSEAIINSIIELHLGVSKT